MINNLFWRLLAWCVSRPKIATWLITRAQRTPYYHIMSADGQNRYMGRWWVFNPYGRNDQGEQGESKYKRLPNVRVHHILRPDLDRHLHDHPWNARTIVLRGWYVEERPGSAYIADCKVVRLLPGEGYREVHSREQGYTGRLLFGEYHRICEVPADGVWTLFFTWKKQGTWGFNVSGLKVPHRQYVAKHGDRA
jgi:hypothetical protein